MDKITRISITVEESILRQFDQYLKEEGFPTRSAAIGQMIRSALVSQRWEKGAVVAGVITIIYDHHKMRILEKITDAQHHWGGIVICSQHAHLDHNNCMENIIVRGTVESIRSLHRDLSAVKGMKHTVLSMTTTGEDL